MKEGTRYLRNGYSSQVRSRDLLGNQHTPNESDLYFSTVLAGLGTLLPELDASRMGFKASTTSFSCPPKYTTFCLSHETHETLLLHISTHDFIHC